MSYNRRCVSLFFINYWFVLFIMYWLRFFNICFYFFVGVFFLLNSGFYLRLIVEILIMGVFIFGNGFVGWLLDEKGGIGELNWILDGDWGVSLGKVEVVWLVIVWGVVCWGDGILLICFG